MTQPPRRSFVVTLTDARREPATVDVRLRMFLKLARRAFGFRAGGVEVKPESKKETKG